jgi:hypothetical protein
MSHVIDPLSSDRRHFLRCALAGGALACIGCPVLQAADPEQEKPAAVPPAHKFQAKSEMTYAEIFKFAYAEGFIPAMQQMAESLGREKLLALLQDSGSKAMAKQVDEFARKLPKRDLANWFADFKKPNPFMEHVLTFVLPEETPTVVQMKITECLWATTFRDAGAADIGYAVCCHPDQAAALAFNPKLKFTRTQTLMQGAPFCNHRYELEL